MIDDRILIDTNILVYAYDYSEPNKQDTALNALDNMVTAENSFLSSQVLSEFFVTVTRKIPSPLTLEQAEERINNFCQLWPVLQVNEIIVLEAVRGVRDHNFSYWDALIWGTARLNQIGMILSEDFTHGSFIEGIHFQNPFLK